MKTSTRKMTSLFRQLGLGVGLGVFAASSSLAGTMITSFDWTQEFEFISATPDAALPNGVVKEGGVNPGNIAGFTKLKWGSSDTGGTDFSKISSLVINPTGDPETPDNTLLTGSGSTAIVVQTGIPIAATEFQLGPVLVHNNFVIFGASLTSAVAADYVELTPSGGGDTQVQQVSFGINFAETLNSLTGSACPSGIEANGCGDIFALTTGFGDPAFVNAAGPAFQIDSFAIDGWGYKVYLQEATGLIAPLSDAACTAAGGLASGCVGFVTEEEQSNFFQLQFAIFAEELQVPAPATLLLMSGSMLSLAWFRRRKASRRAA
jgi:hypothetical protein